mgnify:CR=1 FL=1
MIRHTRCGCSRRAALRHCNCWQVSDVASRLASLAVRAKPLSDRHREERLGQAVLVEGLAAGFAIAQDDVVVELVLARSTCGASREPVGLQCIPLRRAEGLVLLPVWRDEQAVDMRLGMRSLFLVKDLRPRTH